MSDTETKLREYLACYGSDINTWPEEEKKLGREASTQSRFSALIEAEKRFERALNERFMEQSSPDFAERIIAASRLRPQAQDLFSSLLAQVRPAALAAMLVVGFVIGFSMFTPVTHSPDASLARSVSDDEGAVL